MSLLWGTSGARVERRANESLRSLLEERELTRTSWAGVPVTPSSAKTHPTVWRSLQIIAGTAATLPIDAVRKVGQIRQPLPQQPRLLVSPSGEMRRRDWVYQAVESLLLHCNIVGIVGDRDDMMRPTQIELVDVETVQARKVDGRWQWKVAGKEVPTDDIWHVAMNPPAGSIFGVPLLEHARHAIGVGLAAQKYTGQWFADGAHPTAVFESDQEVNDRQAKTIKQRIMDAVKGTREPLVLGLGGKLKPWQSTPSDSQLVETWAQNTTAVANYFGLPPEFVGGTTGDSMTYTNMEARGLHLSQYCLLLWLDPLEKALSDALTKPVEARFNYDAALRVDTITRYRAHDLAIRMGLANVDERRVLEDLPPLPDGKGQEYLWPPYRAFPTAADQEAAT